MSPDDPIVIYIKFLAYAAFAGIAGFLSYLLRQIDARLKINWCVTVIQGIAASFVGSLFYLLCLHFKLPEEMTGVVVGLMGWLGADASAGVLQKMVFKILNISIDIEKDKRYERAEDVSDEDSIPK